MYYNRFWLKEPFLGLKVHLISKKVLKHRGFHLKGVFWKKWEKIMA